jgi:hypothetical protein
MDVDPGRRADERQRAAEIAGAQHDRGKRRAAGLS